ncbi:hypothetical protein [Haloarchaeobius sp. DYHT-AS-18]|uniref:hypothetical protein n=1 Tax=Haloarchaeobius sp. DYHT-AS-18 TaxID=3446117 RepID=UPI003EBA82A7
MGSEVPVEEQYSYDGWLVFNELFQTEIVGEEDDVDDVIENLPTYERGTPTNSNSGFQEQELPEHLSKLPDLTRALEEYSEDLLALRYVDEDWVEEFGFDEQGNEELYYKDYHQDVDIFWDSEGGVMMFKGDKQLLKSKKEHLQADLSGLMKLKPVTFDFDFFLWVLYKEYKGEQLSSDLRVKELNRSETIGEVEDNLGKEVSVKDSDDIIRSLMLIAPVLAGKRIDSIQGYFLLNQNIVQAEIQHGGKVHVKVSDSPLSKMSDLRRMGVTLRFVSELINLFDYWNKLDSDDRYPPPSFFDELGDIAGEEGWTMRFDPQDIKDEYKRKRESSASEGDSSGQGQTA